MKSALLWALVGSASAQSIAQINGNRFLSPYRNQAVTGVEGIVTAKGPNGFWIRSVTPDNDPATSEGIYVYGSSAGSSLAVGDRIRLNGRITEYRSDNTHIYLTEIASPANVVKVSSGNAVKPLVIGQDTLPPPTVQYTSLDNGDIYGFPNGVANISGVNPVLKPAEYGLDFWESLVGELVTVRKPTILKTPNNYRDTWVVGDWATTGRNSHGGITMTDKDANPEAIIIGAPLDGTRNPTTSKMGDQAEDITGIVYQAYGFYSILPLTAIKPTVLASAEAIPVSFESSGDCKGITLGSYNVLNLSPTSSHMSGVAGQIVNYLKTPDIVFLQEVTDDNGSTNNGVVTANRTLSTLAASIKSLSGVTYDFVNVDPAPGNTDGGAPGSNIRTAYLFRPDTVSLYKQKNGGSMDKPAVINGTNGPELTLNPARIDPSNSAWAGSRKPLVAAWIANKGKKPFFTVNVHWSSKGGGTSLHGDVRPPINAASDSRSEQATVTGSFIADILALDPNARVIAGGDFNEFSFVRPMKLFEEISGMTELDQAVGIPPEERYTYTFDMNAQALDHMYVSPVLARSARTQYEHVRANSWATSTGYVSDHDPSVAKLSVCGCA